MFRCSAPNALLAVSPQVCARARPAGPQRSWCPCGMEGREEVASLSHVAIEGEAGEERLPRCQLALKSSYMLLHAAYTLIHACRYTLKCEPGVAGQHQSCELGSRRSLALFTLASSWSVTTRDSTDMRRGPWQGRFRGNLSGKRVDFSGRTYPHYE